MTFFKERSSRKSRAAGPPQAARLPRLGAELGESERSALVEVTDEADRALVCMRPESALRQGLRLRLAAAALRTRHNNIILRRRVDPRLEGKGLWDLYTGFVLVGEAREDAALRLLETDAGIGGLRMIHAADRDDEKGRLSLFVADLPAGIYPVHPAQELLEADSDELRGLARDAAELLSAEALWAEASGVLFR